MFGERLKLTRKGRGLSLRALSSNIDGRVSAQAIGKYERGEMMPSSEVAIALANALEVSMSYLLSPSTVTLGALEFRKLASARAKDRAAVEGEVLDSLGRYLEVEEVLGISGSTGYGLAGTAYSVDTMEDVEEAAASVREDWDLGSSPIPDLTELLEEHGVKVFALGLPNSVDGLSCRVSREHGTDVPVVVCSDAKSVERQRFTIAHELGHLVLDVLPPLDEEKACQRFAGALLAPHESVAREIGARRANFGYSEIMDVKRIFGISAAALVVRMRDLRIIGDTVLTGIFRGIGRGWRKAEPCPLERSERPNRFRRLCLRALAENEISMSKAVELLRLRNTEVERLMEGSAANL